MYKKLFFTALTISLSITAFAQAEREYEHNFSIGTGFVQTMNTASWYSGLRGVNTSFDYEFIKQIKKYLNNFWGVFTEGNYDFLQTNRKFNEYLGKHAPKFYRMELTLGGKYLWRLPPLVKNLNIHAGTGLSINCEFNYYTNWSRYFYNYPDFNWYISPDLHLRAEYNLKKINLNGELFLPVAMFGNYSAYPFLSNTASMVRYNITINTFTFLHRIFQPTIKLSVLFPLKKSEWDIKQWYFQLKYVFESIDVNLKNYIERKEQHTLMFGFVCM